MVKTTIFNCFSQMHPGDQFFLVISTNQFLQCVHDKSYGMEIRSVCYISDGIYYFTTAFAGYFPLILIYLFNFHILSVARKQRKRILAETTITSGDRMSFVTGFFVALRQAKTFAIVIAVLTFCILTPTVVEEIVSILFTDSTYQIWVVFFHYELYGINSVVNAFIYGMRHVRYRKALQHILFKLFSCHKATKWELLSLSGLSQPSTSFFMLSSICPLSECRKCET